MLKKNLEINTEKLYNRIDEQPKFGSDFDDLSIFPSIIETQATVMINQKEEYIMQKLFELNIDPDVLKHQLEEIRRLNDVINKLENALDIACEQLAIKRNLVDLIYDICITKEEWKEALLKEVDMV